MNPDRRQALRTLQRAIFFAGIAGAAVAQPAEAFLPARVQVRRPAEQEFGFGPRASEKRMYEVGLWSAEPLRVRKLQSVRLLVMDATGRPVDGARISIDGGMPEHAQGLPTQPRVTRALGGGMYEVEGLRFSMGGWWELRLAIETSGGTDLVTFNLALRGGAP